jgi:uncharacterized protein (DUF433 family)
MDKNDLLKRVTTHPQTMSGKPTIRGTRLTVEHLLKALAGGVTFEALKEDYPFLEQEDVLACLWYASVLVEQERIYPVAA